MSKGNKRKKIIAALIFALIPLACIFVIAWYLQENHPLHTLISSTSVPKYQPVTLAPHKRGHRSQYMNNTFIQVLHQTHLGYNTTDCWVCGFLPASYKTKAPLIPLPFSFNGSCSAWREFNVVAYLKATDTTVQSQLEKHLFFLCWPKGPRVYGTPEEKEEFTAYDKSSRLSSFMEREMTKTAMIPIPVDDQVAPFCIQGNGLIAVGNSTCSHTVSLNYTSPSLVSSQNTYFVCGDRAYVWLPEGWSGNCYIAFLLPPVYIAPSDYHKTHRLHKREVEVDQTETSLEQYIDFNLGFFFFIGPVVNSKKIRRLTRVVEAVVNQTAGALSNLTAEVQATRVVALQNRLVLDVILADRGGACSIIGSSCCVYIPDNAPTVYQAISNLRDLAAGIHEETGTWTWSGWIWGILTSWGWKLLTIAACIVGAVLGCCICIQCLPLICSMCTSACTSCRPNNINIHDTNKQMMLQQEVDDLMNIEVGDQYDDVEKTTEQKVTEEEVTEEQEDAPCSPPPLSIASSDSNDYTCMLAPAESYYMTPNIPAPPSSRRPLRHP